MHGDNDLTLLNLRGGPHWREALSKGVWKKGLPRILETLEALEALGTAQREGDVWRG